MQRAPVFTENVTQNVPSILTARLQSVCSLANIRKGTGLSQNVISLVINEYIGSSRQTSLSTRGLGSLPYQSYKINMVYIIQGTSSSHVHSCLQLQMQNYLH